MGGYEQIKIAGQMSVASFEQGKPRYVIVAPHIKGSKLHMEAMWGMIAILHDLGYPVEAISNKPNEMVHFRNDGKTLTATEPDS